jgi:transcription termination factor NusA
MNHTEPANEPDESPAAMFQRVLGIGAQLAETLERGGITSIDEVAYVPHWELAEVGNLDEIQTQRLREVARAYLLSEALKDPGYPPNLLDDEPPEKY